MSASASGPDQADRYHHGNLREALLDAAVALMEDGSVDAITLRAVARRAGVSAMAPYRHYKDKDALLAAVARCGFQTLHDILDEADRTADRGSELVAQGVAYVGFAAANPVLFRLMFGPGRLNRHPELARTGDSAFDVLVRRVNRTRDPKGTPHRILACWSLVHGLAMLVLDGRTTIAGFDILTADDLARVLGPMLSQACRET